MGEGRTFLGYNLFSTFGGASGRQYTFIHGRSVAGDGNLRYSSTASRILGIGDGPQQGYSHAQ